MTARAETFFRSQHLPDGNTVFAKQLIVPIDQFCLAHRREKLPLLHAIQFLGRLDLAASRSYRPG